MFRLNHSLTAQMLNKEVFQAVRAVDSFQSFQTQSAIDQREHHQHGESRSWR